MREWLDRVQEVTKDFPKLRRRQVDEIIGASRSDRRWDDDR